MKLLYGQRITRQFLLPLLLAGGGRHRQRSRRRVECTHQLGRAGGPDDQPRGREPGRDAAQLLHGRDRAACEEGRHAAGFDYAEKEGTLPLPATLVKALGASVAKEYPGTEVRLMSNHPFPNRAAESSSTLPGTGRWPRSRKTRRLPCTASRTSNGRLSMRYAVADVHEGRLRRPATTGHPQSPKKDWKVGDVRGSRRSGRASRSGRCTPSARSAMRIAGLIDRQLRRCSAWCSIVLTLRFVSAPLREAAQVMERVTTGDLSRERRRSATATSLAACSRAWTAWSTRCAAPVGELSRELADSIHTASERDRHRQPGPDGRTEQTAQQPAADRLVDGAAHRHRQADRRLGPPGQPARLVGRRGRRPRRRRRLRRSSPRWTTSTPAPRRSPTSSA